MSPPNATVFWATAVPVLAVPLPSLLGMRTSAAQLYIYDLEKEAVGGAIRYRMSMSGKMEASALIAWM